MKDKKLREYLGLEYKEWGWNLKETGIISRLEEKFDQRIWALEKFLGITAESSPNIEFKKIKRARLVK